MAYEHLIPLAALPLRLILGIVMLYHGKPKLTKKGFRAHVKLIRSLKWKKPSPKFWALCSTVAEFFGGLAVLLGAFTRIGAALIAVNMLVAVYAHKFKWGTGFDVRENGYEYALSLAAMAIALMLLGAGNYALDFLYNLPFA